MKEEMPPVGNQKIIEVPKVMAAIALSKQWKQERVQDEKDADRDAGFWAPEIERNSQKWAERMVIHEDDPMLAEKVEAVNSPYDTEQKKELLLIIKDLEAQKNLPIETKKEAAALLVPYPAALPELIKDYKHLVWEFVSHNADDEILYYAFHRAWEYVVDLNLKTKNQANYFGKHVVEDVGESSDFLAGEKSYMGEGLLWEVEKGFEEALDFEDENQYAQTATLLEFLKHIMDQGPGRLLFVTLQDVLKKKVKQNTGMLLKLRAEEILAYKDDSGAQMELISGEILSMADKGIDGDSFFRYEKDKVAVVKNDGLYVSDLPDSEAGLLVGRLEENESKLRDLIHQRNVLAHKCDFLFHILESKKQGEDGESVAFGQAEAVKEAENITSPVLRERSLEDNKKYFDARRAMLGKSESEISEQIDEAIKQIRAVESQISVLKRGREGAIAAVQKLIFRKTGLADFSHTFSLGNAGLESQTLLDYRYLLTPAMRRKIETMFSYPIQRLSANEQFQFLNYIKTKKEEEIKKVQSFVARYGGNGFRTFLSLEYGKELGDSIIALGDKLSKEEAGKIFAKYGELADAAEEVEEYVRTHFSGASLPPEAVSAVRENLLRKGKDMLASFSAEVASSRNTGYELAIPVIERDLGLLRGDTALFTAAFRELSKRGEQPNLAEIKDVKFARAVSPSMFSAEDRKRMKELYSVNYAASPEFQKMLLEGFERALADSSNRFYVLRHKGVIEGFYRLASTELDTVYFGAFNMNPKSAGSGLGEALMQQSLDVEAKDSVVIASCTAVLPIASNYIERGFVGTGAEQVKEIYSMDIIRNDARKDIFRSKDLTAEEIKTRCQNGLEFRCEKVPLGSLSPEHFSLLNEKGSDGSRFVITRYVRDKETDSAYLVFEKTDEETIKRFSSPEKPLRFEH